LWTHPYLIQPTYISPHRRDKLEDFKLLEDSSSQKTEANLILFGIQM